MAEDFTIKGKIKLDSTEAEKTLDSIESRLARLPQKFEVLSISKNTGEALNDTLGTITMIQEEIKKLSKLQPNLNLSPITSVIDKYETDLLKIKTSIHSRITDEAKWAKVALSDIAASSKNALVTSINDAKRMHTESERLTREAEKNIEQAEKRRAARDKKRIADAKKYATQSEARLTLEQERRELERQEQINAAFARQRGSDRRARIVNGRKQIYSYHGGRPGTDDVYDYVTGQWVKPYYRSGQPYVKDTRMVGTGKTRLVESYRPSVAENRRREVLPTDTIISSSEINTYLTTLKSRKKADKQKAQQILSQFYGGDLNDVSFLQELFPEKDFQKNIEGTVKSVNKNLKEALVQTLSKSPNELVLNYARNNAIALAGGVDRRPKRSTPAQGGYSGAGRISVYETDLYEDVVERYIEDDPEKIKQILKDKAERIAIYNKLTAADRAILRREGGASRESMSEAFKKLPKHVQDALFGPTEIVSDWGWVTDANGQKKWQQLESPQVTKVDNYMSASQIREDIKQLDLARENAPELYKGALSSMSITNKDLQEYDAEIKKQNEANKKQIDEYISHQVLFKDMIDTGLLSRINSTMTSMTAEDISAADVNKGIDELNGLVDVFGLLTGFNIDELKNNIRRLAVVDPKSVSSYISSVLKPSFWRTYNSWNDVILGGNPSVLLDRMEQIKPTTSILPQQASSYISEGKLLTNFEQYINARKKGDNDLSLSLLSTLTASELQTLANDYPELLTRGPQRPANFMLDAMKKQDLADEETRKYIKDNKLSKKGAAATDVLNSDEVYEAEMNFLEDTENAIFSRLFSDLNKAREAVLLDMQKEGVKQEDLAAYAKKHNMSTSLSKSVISEIIQAADSADTNGITDQLTASGYAIADVLAEHGIDEKQLVKLAEQQGYASVEDFLKALARVAIDKGEAVLEAAKKALIDKVNAETLKISKTELKAIGKIPGMTEEQLRQIKGISGTYSEKMHYLSELKTVKGSGEFRTEEPTFTPAQLKAISEIIGTPYDRAEENKKTWWNSPSEWDRKKGAYSFATTDFTGMFGIDKGGLELSSRFNNLRDLALAVISAKERKDDIAYEQALKDLVGAENELYEQGGYHAASRRLLGSMLRADAEGDLDTVILRKSQLKALSSLINTRSAVREPIMEEIDRFYDYKKVTPDTYSLTKRDDEKDWLTYFVDRKRVHYHPYLDRDKRQEILEGSTLDLPTLLGTLAWSQQGFDITQGVLPSAFNSLTDNLLRYSLRSKALKEYTPIDVSSLDVSPAGISEYVAEAQSKVNAFMQSYLSATRDMDKLNVLMSGLEEKDLSKKNEIYSLLTGDTSINKKVEDLANIEDEKARSKSSKLISEEIDNILINKLRTISGSSEDATVSDMFTKAAASINSRKFGVISRLGDFVSSGQYIKGYEKNEETGQYDKPIMASVKDLISSTLYEAIMDLVKRVSSGVVTETERANAELLQDKSEDAFLRSQASESTRVAMTQYHNISDLSRRQLYSMQDAQNQPLTPEEIEEARKGVDAYIVDLGKYVRKIGRTSNKNLKNMTEEDWSSTSLPALPANFNAPVEVMERLNAFSRLYSNKPSTAANEKIWGDWKKQLEAEYAGMRQATTAYYTYLEAKRAEDVAKAAEASEQKTNIVKEEVAKQKAIEEKAFSVDWAAHEGIDKQRKAIERAYKGNKLTIFDTETTGTDPKTAQLLQLSARKVNSDGTLGDSFNKYITPTEPIPEQATKVNALIARDGMLYRIKQDIFEQLKKEDFKSLGPDGFDSLGLDQLEKLDTSSLQEVLAEFSKFIDKTRTVGFNSDRFDSELLKRLFAANGVNAQYSTGDVAVLAQRFTPAGGHRTLSDYADLFGIATPDAHNAMGDVQTTVELLKALLEQYDIHDRENNPPSESFTPPGGGGPNNPPGGVGPWALEATLKNETNTKLTAISEKVDKLNTTLTQIDTSVNKVTADSTTRPRDVDPFGETTGKGIYRVYDSATALSAVDKVSDVKTQSDIYAKVLSSMSGVDALGKDIGNADFRKQFIELSEAAGLAVEEANVYVSNGIKRIEAVVSDGTELLQVKVKEVGDSVKVITGETTASIKRKYTEVEEAQTHWADKLKEQNNALKKADIKELEVAGKYKEATKLKLQLLKEEETEALALLERDIAANKSTEEEKLNLLKYYKNERKRIREEGKEHTEREPFSTEGMVGIEKISGAYPELVSNFSRINAEDVHQMEEQFRQAAEAMGVTVDDLVHKEDNGVRQIVATIHKGTEEAKITVKQAGEETKTTVEDVSKNVKGSAERSFASLQSVLSLLSPILKGIGVKQLVSAAGAAEKALKSLQATTGRYAKEALAMVDTLNEAYGMAKTQAAQALTYAYNQISEVGISNNQALQMSNALVQLGADYSAYYGGAKSAMEVTQALTQVMLGSYRAARQYGIAISSTDVEQLAIAYGKQANNLSEAEKMLYRYQVVMSRASNVMGEYERTAGTYFNAQQELNRAWSDAKIALGDQLLPIATELLNTFTALAESLGDGGVGGPLLMMVVTATSAASAFMKLAKSVEGFAKAVGVSNMAMGGIIAGLVTVLSLIAIGVSKLEKKAEEERKAAAAAYAHADAIEAVSEATKNYTASLGTNEEALKKYQLASIVSKLGTGYKENQAKIEEAKADSLMYDLATGAAGGINIGSQRFLDKDITQFTEQRDSILAAMLSSAKELLPYTKNIDTTIEAIVAMTDLEGDDLIAVKKYLKENLSIYDAIAANAKAVVDYSSKLETAEKNLVSLTQKRLESRNELYEAYKIELQYLDEVYNKELDIAKEAASNTLTVNMESAITNAKHALDYAKGDDDTEALADRLEQLQNADLNEIEVFVTDEMNAEGFKGTEEQLGAIRKQLMDMYGFEETEAALIVGAYKSMTDRQKLYLKESEKLLLDYIDKQDVAENELKKNEFESVGGDIYQSMDARRRAYSDLLELQNDEVNTAYTNQVALIKKALSEGKISQEEYNAYMDRAERKRLRDSKANFDSYISNIKNATDEIADTRRTLLSEKATNVGDFQSAYDLAIEGANVTYQNATVNEADYLRSEINSLLEQLSTAEGEEKVQLLTRYGTAYKELISLTGETAEEQAIYNERMQQAKDNAYLEYIQACSAAFKEYATNIANAKTPLEEFTEATRTLAEHAVDQTSDPTGAITAYRSVRQAFWDSQSNTETLRSTAADTISKFEQQDKYRGKIDFKKFADANASGALADMSIEDLLLKGVDLNDVDTAEMEKFLKEYADKTKDIARNEFADVADAIADGLTQGLSSIDELFSMYEQNEQTHIQNRISELKKAYDDMKEQMEKRNDQSYDNLTRSQKDAIERQKKMDEEELERQQALIEEQEAMLEDAKRKEFERQKAFNIAEATIAGIKGAIDAYTSMASIPYVGAALGVAAAAAVTAFTAAKINAIASQEYQASYAQGAYNLPQDQTAQVHKGEMIIPRPFAQELRDEVSGNASYSSSDEITINVYGATDDVSVESNTVEGNQQLDIYLTQRVKTMVARGELDNALQTRYSISKNGRRS